MIKLFSGKASVALSKKIAQHLNLKISRHTTHYFNDGELSVEILDNVLQDDVYIIQSTHFPANNNLMELLMLVDALKSAGARSMTAVIPYFGYARADMTAKLIASLLETAGIDYLITVDLHSKNIQNFFEVPSNTIYAAPAFINTINNKHNNTIVVSPDKGGISRARNMANILNADFVMIDKHHKSMDFTGSVKGKHCLIIDDIVDTAGTICNAAKILKKKGAKSIQAYVTHPVLSGDSLQKIQNAPLDKLIVSDSIPVSEKILNHSKISVVSISTLIAQKIISKFTKYKIALPNHSMLI